MLYLKPASTLLAFLFVFLSSNVTVLSQGIDPSPQTIVKKMAERYAALSSYEDTGVVDTVSEGSFARRKTDLSFKTYFTRPNRLRFEWLDYFPLSTAERNVIWSDGTKVFGFYSVEPERIETKEDISLAVAGATGVSRGSAHTIPELLMSEVGGFSVTELAKLSLKRQEAFEGEECYVVEGFHPNGEAWQLWISKNNFLLRKIRNPTANGQLTEQIHRDIKVDGKVPDAIYHPKVVGGRIADVIAKEKEDDIRRLLELVAPRDRINQELNDVLELLKKAMPQVPEKTWQEVITELRLNSDMLFQIYVPIYDWHFTGEEIKQLIVLCESPIGRKLIKNSELIELQATNSGVRIGKELIERIQEKLRSKGYKSAALHPLDRKETPHACTRPHAA